MIATAGTEDEEKPPAGRGLVLRLWGLDAEHVQDARAAFDTYPSRPFWRIIDTDIVESQTTPIPSFDPDAVAQEAGYGCAWAVYPAAVVRAAA